MSTCRGLLQSVRIRNVNIKGPNMFVGHSCGIFPNRPRFRKTRSCRYEIVQSLRQNNSIAVTDHDVSFENAVA
jgi:hypothetical protein